MTAFDAAVSNGDTFDRSCAHWSEQRRREMERFYVLATEDYRQLAISFGWVAWLKQRQRCAGQGNLRILDVACGSGKFPTALERYGNLSAAQLKPVTYDLLDPSPFSLGEARAALRPPFGPGREYLCRIQDLDCSQLRYDLIWATHALYALPSSDLQSGLRRIVDALAPSGAGFIAQACEDSHYLNFYRVYLDGLRRGAGTPYTSAEQILDALNALGVHYEARDIVYDCRAPGDSRRDVEGYLQRCLFDDTLSLDEMMNHPALARYLNECRDQNGWCFRQRVKMIFFTTSSC